MRLDRIRNAALLFTVAIYSAGLAVPGMIAILLVRAWEALSMRWRWVPTALDVPLGAMALAIVGSGLASPWRGESLGVAVYFFLTVLVSIPTVATYVKGSVERVLALLILWIAGGVVAALWGLAQSWSSCFTVLPTAALGPTSNVLGTTLATALILTMGLVATGVVRGHWLWVGIAVMFAGLVATKSRAAWLGLTAGVMALMFAGGHARTRLAVALGCALIGGLGGAVLLPRTCPRGAVPIGGAQEPSRPIFEEVRSIGKEVRSIGKMETNRNRLVLWRTAVKMFADYPIVGTGYGTFRRAFDRYRRPDAEDRDPPTAHNIFLHFAAETGVMGLAAIVSLCAAGLVSTRRWLARSPPASHGRAAAAAVLAALVTILTNQLFDGTALTAHGGFGLLALFAIGATGDRYLTPATASGGYQAGGATSGN